MLSGTLSEALRKLIQHYPNPKERTNLKSELLWLRYFSQVKWFSSGRELQQIVIKLLSASDITNVSKGTVLYRADDRNDCGYFLLSGTVALYSSKTDAERTEWIKRNKRLSGQAKIDEICRLTGFQPGEMVDSLIETFIDDTIHYGRCNLFHQVNSGEYFGFAEMVKLGHRPLSSLAITDCCVITVSKQVFDKNLLQYEKMKQAWMVELLSNNMDSSILLQVKGMFTSLASYIVLKECTNEEILFREGDSVIDTYMIVNGELEVFKDMELSYPKQYANRQLKSIKSKTASITVARSIPGQLVGEEELVSNMRTRTYTVKSLTGDSLLLKIDASRLLKLMNERYDIMKVVSKQAKEKTALYSKTYKELSKKIAQGFNKQFKDYEEKKQDKLVEKVVGQDRITSQEIECLHEQEPGIFYRDTFEKIEKMDMWSSTDGNLRSKSKKEKPLRGTSIPPEHIVQPIMSLDITTQQRILFSTNKNINQADLMVNFLEHQGEKAVQKAEHRKRSSSRSPPVGRQSLKEFKVAKLVMDEATHKRVLIKRGIYRKQIEQTCQTFKVATAFEDNFRPVIESCITRKNGSIGRIQESQRRKQVIDMNYRTTVSKFRSRNEQDESLEPVRMYHSWTIKDLRKTFSTMSKQKNSQQIDIDQNSPMKSTRRSQSSHKHMLEQFDCIIAPSKIKKQGRLSYETLECPSDERVRQYYTAQIKQRLEMNRAAPKFVLLNHMMKPISYKR